MWKEKKHSKTETKIWYKIRSCISPLCGISQNLPVKEDVQVHMNVPPACDTQVPLFWHGWEAHAFNTWLHWAPVQPLLHMHEYVVPLGYNIIIINFVSSQRSDVTVADWCFIYEWTSPTIGVGAQSTLGGRGGAQNQQNLQNSRILHDFCQKMQEFYIIIGRKIFSRILGKHVPPCLLPPPTPLSPTWS